MFNNRYISLLFITLFCFSINVNAETTAPIVKKKLPIQCTDSENYDMTDCEKAQQLNKWVKDQEKVPDNKRNLIATVGDDVLVEQSTGYRIGLHKIRTNGDKKDFIAIKIGVPSKAQMFIVRSFCDVSNSIKVIKNTPDFSLIRQRCASTDRYSKADDGGDLLYYYNFDKRYKRLITVFQNASHQVKEPTQTYSKGLYKLLWRNYNNGDGKPFSMHYDYKITGSSLDNWECLRGWDVVDGCDFDEDAPLEASTYKVIDE